MPEDSILSEGSPIHPLIQAQQASDAAAAAHAPAGLAAITQMGNPGQAEAPAAQAQRSVTPQGTQTPAQPNLPETPPNMVEIGGKAYPVDEVLKWRDRGLMHQDYTRKTQALAEGRREVADVLDEVRNLRHELQTEKEELQRLREIPEPDDELSGYEELEGQYPGLASVMKRQELRTARLEQALAREAQERKDALERSQRESAQRLENERLSAELQELRDMPGFDEAEVLNVMRQRGIAHPRDAFMAIHGMSIGRVIGQRELVERGGSAAPVMGAGQTQVSPSFQQTGRVQAGQFDPAQTDWNSIRDEAQRQAGYPPG